MKKRVYIVHGWGGSPREPMHEWMKKELETKGYEVQILSMPRPEEPQMDAWVGTLESSVEKLDAHTYFIGHSIGCQTILRYLAGLQGTIQIGGCVLIAPWTTLDENALEADGADAVEIAQPWMSTKLDWRGAKLHGKKFACLFSDNDPYVPLSETDVFKNQLGAKIIVEEGKGHYDIDSGITENARAVTEVLEMAKGA